MNTETNNPVAEQPIQQPEQSAEQPIKVQGGDGTSAFQQMLDRHEPQQDSQPEPTDSEEQPEVVEGIEAEEEEAPEDSEEQPESEDSDPEGEEQPKIVQAEDDHVVEIDGESLSIRELKDGYLRQSDYTKKTQELKTETTQTARKEVIAELGGHLAVATTETVEMLKKFKEIDWADLAQKSPTDYAKYRQRYDELQARSQQQLAALKEIETKNEEVRQEQIRTESKKSFEILSQSIPNFDKQLFSEILKHGQSLGLSADELNGIYDHRAITAIYESMLYRQAKAKTKQKSKGVKTTIQKRAGASVKPKPTTDRPIDKRGNFDGQKAFMNKLLKQ